VLGDVEFGFYQMWFDGIFVVSSIGSALLILYYLTLMKVLMQVCII
jgi:hypothetical protein